MRFGKIRPQGKVLDHWQVLREYEVTGAAITTYDLSSLDGNIDEVYRLQTQVINGFSGVTSTSIRFNSDSGANYGTQRLAADGATVFAARYTGDTAAGYVDYMDALGESSQSELLIYAKSGYSRVIMSAGALGIAGTTVSYTNRFAYTWNNTTDNITVINIIANQTGGLGIGTKIILYRKANP